MLTITRKFLTRLQPGHVVLLDGAEHHIVLVNDCRARAVPLKRVKKQYTTTMGEEVEFEAKGRGFNISPDAEIPILRFERLPDEEDDEAG